jgi:hypothetical protein
VTLDLPEAGTIDDLLLDEAAREHLLSILAERKFAVTRGVLAGSTVRRVVDHLTEVGSTTAAVWEPIQAGASNFHRRNEADPRSYVEGVFHQFNFFPWNPDPLGLFELLRSVFEIRNLMAGVERDAYLGLEPTDGATARIAVQFYPRGAGRMNLHRDPIGTHQVAVCLLVMSRAGVDYKQGGLVVDHGIQYRPEAGCAPGDIIWLSPDVVHGVSPVDPDNPFGWEGFRGRWAALLATNRLSVDSGIPDSEDFGRS